MKKLIMALFLIGSLSSFKSTDPFSDLLKKLAEFTKKYPSEKVHLHLDKPFYASGDNIWFKAYVMDDAMQQPTPHSGVLYVELINELDSICNQIKLPLQNGISWGDFSLPDTLLEGNYRIRAYTQLMRNAGPDFFFDKHVNIGNKWTNNLFIESKINSTKSEPIEQKTITIKLRDSLEKPIANKSIYYELPGSAKKLKGKVRSNANGEATIFIPDQKINGTLIVEVNTEKERYVKKYIQIPKSQDQIDLQFMPEGGHLVLGISSKIAFKAIGQNGKGTDIKGEIFDQYGNFISSFATEYLGMGSIYLNPQPGLKYIAKISGSPTPYNLPTALEKGYVLNLNSQDTANLNLKVSISPGLLGIGDLTLLAHKNGNVIKAIQIPAQKQVTKIIIPKIELPSGVIQLSLLNANFTAVAERLAFVENPDQMIDLKLSLSKDVFSKRELVDINLETSAAGNYSLSVTNADVVNPDLDNESSILTSMLLKGDLRGYIEKPNSYFGPKSSPQNLDNLLLTQGWRKINWNEVVNETVQANSFSIEKNLEISGRILRNKKPVKKGSVSLINTTGGFFKIETTSDENGKFIFKDLEFPDSTKFIIKSRTEAGKKAVDILVDVTNPQVISHKYTDQELQSNVNKGIDLYLEQSSKYFEQQHREGKLSKVIYLDPVTIKSQRPNPAKNSANLYGPGNADQVIDGKDFMNAPTLDGYLHGKLERVTIKDGLPFFRQGRMKLIVDGTEENFLTLRDFSPDMIESIEVLVSPTKVTLYRAPALLLTTRRGATPWAIVKYAPGVTTYSPKGYYNSREFYSPKYDINPSTQPDYRTTVFWAPNIVTDDKGQAKLEFFNTDQPGNYRIVIEGVDLDGRIGRKTFNYTVK